MENPDDGADVRDLQLFGDKKWLPRCHGWSSRESVGRERRLECCWARRSVRYRKGSVATRKNFRRVERVTGSNELFVAVIVGHIVRAEESHCP